jgi:hypothetical protein
MPSPVVSILAAVIALAVRVFPALAEKRVALVIGNDAWRDAGGCAFGWKISARCGDTCAPLYRLTRAILL